MVQATNIPLTPPYGISWGISRKVVGDVLYKNRVVFEKTTTWDLGTRDDYRLLDNKECSLMVVTNKLDQLVFLYENCDLRKQTKMVKEQYFTEMEKMATKWYGPPDKYRKPGDVAKWLDTWSDQHSHTCLGVYFELDGIIGYEFSGPGAEGAGQSSTCQ